MSRANAAGQAGATFFEYAQGPLGKQAPEPWKDRLQWIVNQRETGTFTEKKAKAAGKIGVSPEMVRKYLKGEGEPNLDTLSRLMENYPGINPEWLVTGYGRRERPDPNAAVEAIGEVEDVLEKLRKKNRSLGQSVTQAAQRAKEAQQETPQKRAGRGE